MNMTKGLPFFLGGYITFAPRAGPMTVLLMVQKSGELPGIASKNLLKNGIDYQLTG